MRKLSKFGEYIMTTDFKFDESKREAFHQLTKGRLLGDIFNHLRLEHGLTCEDMGNLFGVHKSTISRIEKRRSVRKGGFHYHYKLRKLFDEDAFEKLGEEKYRQYWAKREGQKLSGKVYWFAFPKASEVK